MYKDDTPLKPYLVLLGLWTVCIANQTVLKRHERLVFTNQVDSISVVFIHGSKPKEGCVETTRRLGGLWGGHVEICIDSILYGFEYANRERIHIWPRSNAPLFNSRFTKMARLDWELKNINEKFTEVFIYVDSIEKKKLIEYYQRQMTEPDYDYAFLGHRCTSSVFLALRSAGIVNGIQMHALVILSNFYPRLLRKRLIQKFPEQIKVRPGIACKEWD